MSLIFKYHKNECKLAGRIFRLKPICKAQKFMFTVAGIVGFLYDSSYLVLQAVNCDQALSQALQEVLLFHYTMSSAVMKPMIVFSGT